MLGEPSELLALSGSTVLSEWGRSTVPRDPGCDACFLRVMERGPAGLHSAVIVTITTVLGDTWKCVYFRKSECDRVTMLSRHNFLHKNRDAPA